MERRRRWCAAGLCAFVVSAFTAPFTAQELLPEDEVPITIQNEDLPLALRLSVFVQYLVVFAEEHPETLPLRVARFGLEVDEADAAALVDLYGDFEERQRARHQREMPRLQDAAARAALSEALLLERAAHTGRVLGQWLAHLRRRGRDTDHFVWNFLNNGTPAIALGFGGDPPALDELDRRAEQFERSFERHMGRPLRALAAEPTEGVQR